MIGVRLRAALFGAERTAHAIHPLAHPTELREQRVAAILARAAAEIAGQ